MKMSFWMIGALAAGVWLLPDARAQETTVAPPPGVVLPGTIAVPVATGAVHAAKAPKKGSPASLFGGTVGPSTNGAGMTITSDRIEFDYKEMVIAFDEHVHVVDPQYEMTSDRMLVYLEGTNQIKRIISIGNVDITQPDRHATCDKADYEHASGRIVMTGNPVVTRGADRVVGKKITVWLNDQRVEVEGGRVNLSPETMKNRDIKP